MDIFIASTAFRQYGPSAAIPMTYAEDHGYPDPKQPVPERSLPGLHDQNYFQKYEYPFDFIVIVDEYGRKSMLISFRPGDPHVATELFLPVLIHGTNLLSTPGNGNLPVITHPDTPPGSPPPESTTSQPPNTDTEPEKKDDPGSAATGSTETKKKKKKVMPLVINIPDTSTSTSTARHRLLTRELSHESQIVRRLVRGGSQLAKNCKTRRLSLDKKHIKKIQVITDQGHRVTIIIDYQNGNSTCQFVLKMTDESYKDLQRSYDQDMTLITFKQAVTDVMALLDFKQHFLRTQEALADQVYFAETRLVLVSIQEFLDLLRMEKPLDHFAHAMISLLQQAKPDENVYMFLLMQEYVDVSELSKDDLEHYSGLISYLKERIQDVDESGRNLLVDRGRKKLVILDVEWNQLDWTYHSEHSEQGQAALPYSPVTPVTPVTPEALQEFEFLEYKDLSAKSQSSIDYSLSIPEPRDSGIGASANPESERNSLDLEFFQLNFGEEDSDNDDVFTGDTEPDN